MDVETSPRRGKLSQPWPTAWVNEVWSPCGVQALKGRDKDTRSQPSENMPAKNVGKEEREAPAWTLKDIEKLLDLLTAREISEFEMEKDGLRLRIKRGLAHESGATLPAHFPAPVRTEGTAPAPASAPAATEEGPAELTEELHIIKSPIVGTYYGAPSPNAPPFVKPGDVIQVGQVLCIIEAMKLMNEIESEVAGEIVRMYVENGQPVEYGQSLFAIKPSHRK